MQIQSVTNGAGRDHVKGPRGKGVQPRHGAGRIDVAAKVVEAVKKGLALVEPFEADTARQTQVLQSGTTRGEGTVSDAQVARFGAPGHAAQTDKGRHIGLALGPQP